MAKHILLVDDSERVRGVVAAGLRKFGYDVTEAADAFEAMKIILRGGNNFVAVLTDFNMPDGNGLQLARDIGAVRSDLPVVIFTFDPDEVPGGHPFRVIAKDKIFDEIENLVGKP